MEFKDGKHYIRTKIGGRFALDDADFVVDYGHKIELVRKNFRKATFEITKTEFAKFKKLDEVRNFDEPFGDHIVTIWKYYTKSE